MNFHDILQALGNRETLKGYLGSSLTIILGLDLARVQVSITIAGCLFGIMLTLISIYNMVLKKRILELEILEKERKLYGNKD